jgi:hypothetical protein
MIATELSRFPSPRLAPTGPACPHSLTSQWTVCLAGVLSVRLGGGLKVGIVANGQCNHTDALFTAGRTDCPPMILLTRSDIHGSAH